MREKRTKKLAIRLSDGEWETLLKRAGQSGLSASAYARRVLWGEGGQNIEQDGNISDRNNDSAPRTEAVFIRLTKGEKARLEERARWFGCNVPTLVRRILFSGVETPPVVIDTSRLEKTYLELHRQGVNLNQLMTYLNTYKSNANIHEVTGVLAKVEARLDDLDRVLADIQEDADGKRKRSG